MITQQTASDLWIAYHEIEKGEKLLADLEEGFASGQDPNPRVSKRRPRPLQLKIYCGNESQRLLDVNPRLAIEVIKAHVADKRAALAVLNEHARAELGTEAPHSIS